MKRTHLCLGVALAILSLGVGCSSVSKEENLVIAAALALTEGSTVADVGAGDGLLLPGLAALVGTSGTVIGTEIDATKVAELRELAQELSQELNLPQIKISQGTPTQTGLDENCCDAIVTRMVYHHFTHPGAFIEDLHRSLKPGGTLLVIDFQPSRWMSTSTPEDLPADRENQHGVTPALVIKEVTQHGFSLRQRYEDWPGPGNLILNHFAVQFSRD